MFNAVITAHIWYTSLLAVGGRETSLLGNLGQFGDYTRCQETKTYGVLSHGEKDQEKRKKGGKKSKHVNEGNCQIRAICMALEILT